MTASVVRVVIRFDGVTLLVVAALLVTVGVLWARGRIRG